MNANTLSIDSLTEFLSAYPFNLQAVGEEGAERLLVSNLDDNFELDFDPLRMDGTPIPIYDLLERIAPNDESVVNDYSLHVQRWAEMSRNSFDILHDKLEGYPDIRVNGEESEPLQWSDNPEIINLQVGDESVELDIRNPLPTKMENQNLFFVRHPDLGRIKIEFLG